MKLNSFSKAMIGMGLCCAAVPAFALEAWSGQEGSTAYDVIFNGGVYTNAWWVGADQCPGSASSDEANNPWRYQRAATSAEMQQYGNPTSCEISSGGDTVAAQAFQSDAAYDANVVVSYNSLTYLSPVAVAAYTFTPGADNPWKQYQTIPAWSAATTYNKGDVVQKGGQQYQALFYTQGEDPSNVANQNPTSSNGRPWLPMGAVVTYTDAQLSAAPNFNAGTLYESGTLIRFNGANYVAQSKVQKVSPTDSNPWKIYTDWSGTKDRVGTPKNPWPAHVYAPYVDFSLMDIPDLANLAQTQGINHFTMAFIVSKDADTCLPTWGTAYSLKDDAQYSKIKALREVGGDVMVSIGGANNAPLAASCKNVGDLTQQYHDIVENLNLNVLDFDIEGTWVADQASIERRNQAVKAVQDQWKAEGRKVGIWYTLPILPTGLTAEGLNVLNDAKAKGVELAGVNVMTMDYGNSICQSSGTEGQNIHGKCATSAIENMQQQLKQIFTGKSDAEINAMMGTTPMIGYNDVQGETFYLSDAHLVMDDAVERNLGMIGIWSMARDKPGAAGVVEASHSGLTQAQAPAYAFSNVFSPFTHDDEEQDSGYLGYTTNMYAKGSTKNVKTTQLKLQLDKTHQEGNYEYKLSLNGNQICSSLNGKVTGGSKSTSGDVVTMTCTLGTPVAGAVIKLTENDNTVFEKPLVDNETSVTDNNINSFTIKGKTVMMNISLDSKDNFVLYQNNVYRGEILGNGSSAYMSTNKNNGDGTKTVGRNLPSVNAGDKLQLVRNGTNVVASLIAP